MKLPEAITNYFAAVNRGDGASAAELFEADAVVQDENAEHRGHAAIAAWVEETAAKYKFQVTPLELRSSGDHVIISSRVEGAFPGSPVVLDFDFAITGDRIDGLCIQ